MLHNDQLLPVKLVNEFQINWLFIKRDISSIILPGILFTITALLNYPPASFVEGLYSFGRNILYCWLCITSFCMVNQLNGIEEDRLNKPDRPLVQGIISYDDAKIRWYLIMGLLPLVAWRLGVLKWAIFWQVCIILYEYFHLSKHWVTKNILAGLANISVIIASWEMVAPISPIVWSWVEVLGLAWITLISIQDFRDMEGDQAVGRSTLPLAFGEIPSRILVSFGFLGFPLLIHFVLMKPAIDNLVVVSWDIVLAIISLNISLRVLFQRTKEADHQSYMLFTYWYCLILISSFFVLHV